MTSKGCVAATVDDAASQLGSSAPTHSWLAPFPSKRSPQDRRRRSRKPPPRSQTLRAGADDRLSIVEGSATRAAFVIRTTRVARGWARPLRRRP
jgi:hypothetical protein